MKFARFLLILLINISCSNKKDTSNTIPTQVEINSAVPSLTQPIYNINNADKTLVLNSKLLEISGLSFDSKAKQLVAINDEKGILYYLDLNKGDIISETKFGKKGDYEGVEIIDNFIYTIKSNGDIYPFNRTTESTESKIKTALKSVNDIEGLGYDPSINSLIIACKGKPSIDSNDTDKSKSTKAIYSYNINDGEFKLYCEINDATLSNWLTNNLTETSKFKTNEYNKRAKDFSPSGIAIHPYSKDIYILSSVGKTLVQLDTKFNIKKIHFLNKNIHTQPEGICFDDEANLYISNEGKGLVAKIFIYNYN